MRLIRVGYQLLNLDLIRSIEFDFSGPEATIIWSLGDLTQVTGQAAADLFDLLANRAIADIPIPPFQGEDVWDEDDPDEVVVDRAIAEISEWRDSLEGDCGTDLLPA